ncbi:MAG: 50S ribosomal protein L13 [Nanoarchaeota archaeon]|nr:50S ribosomal protein L13 [Nanoarchaeota archaeon]
MKIIDGTNAILGRLASYAAKESLQGEEVVILNSEKVIITGNKKNIKEKFLQKRRRVGSIQVGPKISRASERIVKRTIRGMLPNYREGRGREAFKRIKCFKGIPKEFADKKMIKSGKEKTKKFIKVEDLK